VCKLFYQLLIGVAGGELFYLKAESMIRLNSVKLKKQAFLRLLLFIVNRLMFISAAGTVRL
jgi:hypothetical protein